MMNTVSNSMIRQAVEFIKDGKLSILHVPQEYQDEVLRLLGDDVSLEDIKKIKINKLSSICNDAILNGVDIKFEDTIKHFSYGEEDQVNLKEVFDLAVQTNVPMYYHADGEGCKLYTVDEIIAIYTSATTNKMHHITYFNQIRMYVDSLESRSDIMSVEYGQELTGEFLETYNESMAQSQLVLEALLSRRAMILAEE